MFIAFYISGNPYNDIPGSFSRWQLPVASGASAIHLTGGSLAFITAGQSGIYLSQAGPEHRRPPLPQAALRAALAEDECDGKDRIGGSSRWPKAGFAVLAAMRRRKPQASRPKRHRRRAAPAVLGSGVGPPPSLPRYVADRPNVMGRGSRCQEKMGPLGGKSTTPEVVCIFYQGGSSSFRWLRRCAPPPQASDCFAQRQLTLPLMVLTTLSRVPWSRPIFTSSRAIDWEAATGFRVLCVKSQIRNRRSTTSSSSFAGRQARPRPPYGQ